MWVQEHFVNGLNRQYMSMQGYDTLTIIKRVLTEKIDLCGSSVDRAMVLDLIRLVEVSVGGLVGFKA